MDDLADLLGQSSIATRLAAALRAPGPQRIWLEGQSGTGKSTILALAARDLAAGGAVLTLVGDAGSEGTSFLAAHRALAGRRGPRKAREALGRAGPGVAKAIPFLGHSVAEVTQWAIDSRPRARARPEFLSAEQQDLLQGLAGVAGEHRLFLLVDDVGALDRDTASLIANLALPEIRAAYPFARDVSILMAQNLDAPASLDPALLDRLRPHGAATRLSRVRREDFGEALRRFGFVRPLTDALADKLYAVSQGHLEIMRQIAHIDRNEDVQTILGDLDSADLAQDILRIRLRDLHPDSTGRLLAIAACAGSAVSKLELACAFADEAEFARGLETALRERLLIPEGETVRFVHEAIRGAAERLATPQRADYHARLGNCLKLLRPGDYAARLRHVQLSGVEDAADELRFVLALQAARGAHASPVRAPAGALGRVLVDAREGYRLMDAGEHRRASELMIEHYDGTHGLVQGEIVALIALNHIKRRTPGDYETAVSVLSSWRRFTDERELHERLMSVLASALSMSGRASDAAQLNADMMGRLLERANSEPWARSRAEALGRKADMFLSTELSLKHIERAARWFGPAGDTELPRNAFEYTASLVNLAGARYTLGQFPGAAEAAGTALACMKEVQPRGLRTAEPYKALNNYLIAGFRSGEETAASALEGFDLMTAQSSEPWLWDRCLFAINRGVLAILAGDLESGTRTLDGVWQHVTDEELDGYYVLYAAANLAAARTLEGETSEALRLLGLAAACLECVPRWLQPYHRRRHAIAVVAAERGDIRDAAEWDDHPFSVRRPAGSQDFWWSVGRGFLMSDIQVWSEG